MRHSLVLLPGLLVSGITSFAQTATPPPAETTVSADAPTDKLQLRVGLNAARLLRHSGYYGIGSRVPVSVGVEYALNRRFTLYGQADADFSLFRQDPFRRVTQPLVPTGALSIGGRYYYNQAGRARHQRAQGSFVGNYLAAELHSEMLRAPEFVITSTSPNLDGYYTYRTRYAPTLNLLWGMQRRLGRNFLFDLNGGIGISPTRPDAHFGVITGLNLSPQVNLGIYFGR